MWSIPTRESEHAEIGNLETRSLVPISQKHCKRDCGKTFTELKQLYHLASRLTIQSFTNQVFKRFGTPIGIAVYAKCNVIWYGLRHAWFSILVSYHFIKGLFHPFLLRHLRELQRYWVCCMWYYEPTLCKCGCVFRVLELLGWLWCTSYTFSVAVFMICHVVWMQHSNGWCYIRQALAEGKDLSVCVALFSGHVTSQSFAHGLRPHTSWIAGS